MNRSADRLPAPVCRAIEQLFSERITRELGLALRGPAPASDATALAQASQQLAAFFEGLLQLSRNYSVPFVEVMGHVIRHCRDIHDDCIDGCLEVK